MSVRRIVITGASSQIGLAIAAKLAAKDVSLLLQCNKHDAAVAAWAGTSPWACEILKADFTRPEDLERFCKSLGEVDILVNAAACTKTGVLPALSEEDISHMIAVNMNALALVCRAVMPAMLVRRSGCIVNISSVAAFRGNRGQSVYAGTKGFLESFTRSLAAECGGRGIRVNSVAPGAIDAGSLKELLSYTGDLVKNNTALGRLGAPEDVASAVAFLCGPDAAFINGACINVNGGFMAGI